MKLTKSLLMVTILAGVAFAQAPSTANVVAAQLKKSTAPAKTVAPPAKPTMPASKPEHIAAKPHKTAKHAAAAHHVSRKTVAAKTATEKKAATDTAETSDNAAPELKRGRDPFVSVIQERTGNIACAGPGKKCLIVDQVLLRGVVRSQGEAIAVVSSSANKTYFLRENDPVYNGVVVKITPDSIVFRESVTDRLGKTVQREVVKKVNNPAA
jgi:hypothetical protein